MIGNTLLAVLAFAFTRSIEDFWVCFFYAQVIGMMASFILPAVTPPLGKHSVVIRNLVLGLFLLICGTAGSLVVVASMRSIGWMRGDFWQVFQMQWEIAVVITLVCGFLMSSFESLRERLEETTLQLRTKELERERAWKLASEARLATLESRIHPHFLFNALNSISALIRDDPARAERLIERMAALLRSSLEGGASGLVPLENEVKLVGDYLEIESARFGSRLRYRMDVAPELGSYKVPPFALQTLVENSVKYAVSPSRAGAAIEVSAERINDTLRLAVADTGPGFSLENTPTGHGIDNLRGRLEALFGSDAHLNASRTDGRTVVSVSVPQVRNGHSRIPG